MIKHIQIGITAAALCLSLAACHKKPVAQAKPATPAPEVAKSEPTPAPRQAPVERASTQEVASAPQSRMPDAATRARIQELLDRIQDAYFDYNQKTLRPDAETALKSDAQTLTEIIKQYPEFHLTVEGHCDERGSDEYNLALGEARAKQALEYMSNLGFPANQLKVVTFGKEKPVCTEHDEACWQKNRRAHITQAQ
jgi:peptidoglycan-associated lipoprotein